MRKCSKALRRKARIFGRASNRRRKRSPPSTKRRSTSGGRSSGPSTCTPNENDPGLKPESPAQRDQGGEAEQRGGDDVIARHQFRAGDVDQRLGEERREAAEH